MENFFYLFIFMMGIWVGHNNADKSLTALFFTAGLSFFIGLLLGTIIFNQIKKRIIKQ
jgi:hypothetical protein